MALVAAPLSVQAHEKGDFLVRVGLAHVAPDASSSELVLDGGAVAGSEADVGSNTQLGLNFTYMLTDNWAIDVLASTPFTHDITAETGALGLGNIDAGETKHLPPTVSLVYFFADSGKKFQPYVGLGFNDTTFFDEKVDSELEGVLGDGSLDLEDSFGLAVQAGFGYELSENLFLNAGVFWIDIDTETEFKFDSNRIKADVDIDPLVYMLTLGWKF